MQISFKELDDYASRRANALFPKKNCFIEVLPGNFVFPRKFIELSQSIKDLEVFPDDIWLVSYPRTGSTWAQEMIWLLKNNLDFEGAKRTLQFRAPIVELSALFSEDHNDWISDVFGNTVEAVHNMSRPRCARSHLPWHLLPEGFETIKPKIIYTARNPKDLCVSFYHYCKTLHKMKGSLEDFVELFLEGSTPIGPYWKHVLPFWKRSNDLNVLFIKYEDMNRNLPSVLRKCAKFLNVEHLLTEENMRKLCEHLNFNKMRSNTALNLESLTPQTNNKDTGTDDARFIRKGQIGDWKNYFTPEQSECFDQWIDNNTKGSGLSFEYE